MGRMVAIGLSILVGTTGSTLAKGKAPFSKVVSLGDSLSDTGNFFQATGVPPFPYWEGRASDGPVWVEHLATKLNIPTDPADQYAWLGSMTGDRNFRDIPEANIFFPGFEQQVDAFLASSAKKSADPDALYTVWIGANDFFDWLVMQNQTPEQLVANGVANTVRGIMALANAGARHFIVGNVPDLGITPDGQALGPAISATLSQLSFFYNLALEEQLANLDAVPGIFISRLDAFGILNRLATEPASFGLTNVSDQALASYPSVDSSEYLFWDGVHPTTAAHEWTADFACAELVRTYTPPKIRGLGPTNASALNGLVQAATRRK